MPCYQQAAATFLGLDRRTQTSFATEADCLNACKEGACCEANGTCSVEPQCQCQGTGQTFRGVGTTCTPNPCLPCGCSPEVFQQLENLVLKLSYSGFSYTGRLGTGDGNSCDCNTQYGFDAFSMGSQTSFQNAWRSHFNSITADLSFDSATATAVIWRGKTTSMSTPGGGTATYYFSASAQCSGLFGIGPDVSKGCQRNLSFSILTAADFSQPPLAFAPSFSGSGATGEVLVDCNGLQVRSLYSGVSQTQVFCGGTGALGCVEANGCGGNYYRARFNGNASVTTVMNPLP